MPTHKIYGYDEELWCEVLKQQEGTGERDLTTILSVLESFGTGKEIVDLGCGTGRISNRLAKAGYFVTGIDLSSRCVEEATRTAMEMGVSEKTRYLIGDYRDLGIFSGKCYDAALCILAPSWNSIEEFSTALKVISSLVRRGGLLLLRETVKERFLSKICSAPSVQHWYRISGDLLSLHSWNYDPVQSRVRATKEFYRKTDERGSLSFLTRIEEEYSLRGIADYVQALEAAGWQTKFVLEDSFDLLHICNYNDPWWSFSSLFVASLP
ncbi:MAG: class I SAM-dependent methyltransferase [Candidatus Methanosuratincola petrocarbonis]